MKFNFTSDKIDQSRFFAKHLAFLLLMILAVGARGQVVVTNPGNTTPVLAATYTSLANAITALNSRTAISGQVIITLTGNETTPVGGYQITAIPAGASATNNIIIQGSGSTITAFTPQASGTIRDAIFKIIGADYMTIQNFTMLENAANSTTAAASNNMTEFGVALFYASTTNGAQNNTIQNNTISLNKNYTNTFGIYSNTRHTATSMTVTAEVTSVSGSNSGNKIYGNSISNVNYGISFIGAGTTIAAIDNGNDIGGNALSTANIITNWGGGSTASSFVSITSFNCGVYMNQQINDNVSFNTIISAALTSAVSECAILKVFTVASPTSGTITTNINNNTVTVNNNPSAATGVGVFPINNQGLTPLLASATININNNLVQNCTLGGSTSTTNGMVGIVNLSLPGTLNMNGNSIINNAIAATSATSGVLNAMANYGDAGIVNMNGNIVRNMSSTATSGQMQGISNTGAVVTTLNINNNQLGNTNGGFFSSSVVTSGALFGITSIGGASTCTLSMQNNDIRGITYSVTSSAQQIYLQNTATTLSQNISNNTFTDLNIKSSGIVIFIDNNVSISAIGSKNINSNSIVTGFNKSVAGNSLFLYDDFASSAAGSTVNNNNNNFSNITVTGATSIWGWVNEDGGSPTKTVTGNTFSNWIGGSSAVNVLEVSFSGNANVSSNTISNISSSGDINGIVSVSGTQSFSANTIHTLSSSKTTALVNGFYISGGTAINIFKNKIYNLSGSSTTPLVTGITVSAGSSANLYNNLIGDLKAPAGSNGLNDVIRGINITSTTTSSTIKAYYNTIDLFASGGANFSSSCIYHTYVNSTTSAALDLRNNILVNNSTASGTGLTVAFRRSNNNNLSNYAAASNNNLLYAGTPGISNLIYYDGTNKDQTLATFKVRVSARETNSVTENPTFLSTAGLSISFLHIDPTVGTLVLNGALPIATYTVDYDADIRHASTPDIGADELGDTYTWTGALSTVWSLAGNWSPAAIPRAIDNAIIPNVTNKPALTAAAAITNLDMAAGAFVNISGQTFTINGAITGTGTLTGSATSNLVINGAAGTLNFTGGSQILKDLTINSLGTATLGNALDITAGATAGTVIVNGTLNTAGLLTIKSDANGTARVGTSAGTISGQVTVERYILPRRAWRFLTAPITPTGAPTINASWMEGGQVNPIGTTSNINPGFGTHITGSTNLLLGFDQNPAGNPSTKKTVNVWTGINNTFDPVTTEEGYMVFVRGSRANILTSGTAAVADATILRAKGILKSGTQAYTQTGAGPKVIGNPFASAITLPSLWGAALNIPMNYSVWDPKLTGSNSVGGFVQYIWNGTAYDVSVTPISPIQAGVVESGSAFIVDFPTGTNTLSLNESHKSSGSNTVQLAGGKKLRINLKKINADASVSLQDGMLTNFSAAYSNDLDNYDAIKITNFSQSISSKRNGTKIAIERRAIIANTDTIYIDFNQVFAGNYRFELIADSLNQPDRLCKLVDQFTNTNTPVNLNGTTTYDFAVSADPASAANDRFKVVFYPAPGGGPLPVTFTGIKATQQNKDIAVEWQVANQVNISKYEVEKSTDGRHFTAVATQQPIGINGANATYNWLDVNAVTGDHFYRISSTGFSGDIKLSSIVKVTIGKGIPAIVVYPNPVVNNTIALQFTDMPKGDYGIRLMNMLGQTVQSKQLTHSGSNTTQRFAISQGIARGNYRLQIVTPDGETWIQKIVIAQ